MHKINTLVLLTIISLLISCAQPEPRRPTSHASDSYLEQSVMLNKYINKIEHQALDIYMQRDSLATYQTSQDGFWYKEIVSVSDELSLPVKGDRVVFEYEIQNLAGQIVYSKEELGEEEYFVDQEDLITGLQNGIKLMREGEEFLFLFPSFKAYGFTGDQVRIKSNQPLVYKVKMLKLNK